MKIIILLLLAIVAQTSAFAGPSTSGGAFAVVCRNENGIIQSSEILDLYEAKQIHGLKIMSASGDLINDYIRGVKNGYRLQGAEPSDLEIESRQNVINFLKIVNFLPANEKLPNSADYGELPALPINCSIEPLAIFYDAQKIVDIDKEIWSSLDSLNQAALVLHELYYHYFRQLRVDPDTNSMHTRAITAADFSLDLTPVKSGIPSNIKPTIYYHDCENGSFPTRSCEQATAFYKFPTRIDQKGIQNYRIQFTHILGRPMISITTIDFPQIVNLGDIYNIKSRQLRGWTAEVAINEKRIDGVSLKLIIRDHNKIVLELSL